MQQKNRRRRPWWIIGVVTVLIGAAFFLWRSQRPSSRAAAQTEDRAVAFIGSLADTATASGQVVSLHEASLAVSTPGRVTEVAVQPGDSVAAGDVLVQLEREALALSAANAEQALRLEETNLADLLAAPAAAEVAAAEAAISSVVAAAARLDSTQANYNLQARGATATQLAAAESQLAQAKATLADLQEGAMVEQIVIAEASVEQARLALADAEEALAQATVVAPFDGVVTAVHVREGEIASGVMVELADLSRLEVVVPVDEVDIGTR
jgi:multidrug efflux pump subunit AcrA (membrane-fusion protein)